jgi:hypothetical protein
MLCIALAALCKAREGFGGLPHGSIPIGMLDEAELHFSGVGDALGGMGHGPIGDINRIARGHRFLSIPLGRRSLRRPSAWLAA